MHKIWFIDMGHGGMLDGKYTTAPRKMFKHADGKVAYEGVIDRNIGHSLHALLKLRGFHSIIIESALDIPLKARTTAINDVYKWYRNLVTLSIHCNASPTHRARGFEIITSRGDTPSDPMATVFGKQIMKNFPKLKFRTGYCDPKEESEDLDKEMDLAVTRDTDCPAILFENLFFDNPKDFELLRSYLFIYKLTNSYVTAIREIEKSTL